MSLVNLTGQDADPVKALVFRELREASVRRRDRERLDKEDEENRKADERREQNRRWREKRAERRRFREDIDIEWESEDESEKSAK